jgi:ribonucleoside-diphosphate reductase alpha chain
MDFLDLRKNHGNEEERARDLFYAMWVPDLFMERVKVGGTWSLMCPDACKGLADVYGDEFVELYERYEAEGRYIKQMPAQDVWFKILESQIETGVPYIGFKDHVNRKSNQQNIGIIKSSNLCMEIMQVSKPDETAVCNLASLCLKTYVKEDEGSFDFESLHLNTKVLVKNLNKIIDRNFYPIEKAERSNKKHRPIGIGVQGLADGFALLRMPFDSAEAAKLNVDIFETMYHAAVEASMELAIKHGPYSTFEGSPMSQGIFQFDMWGVTPLSDRYDWPLLKKQVQEHGVMNSLLISPMPTASTSQIMSANECFEPFTSNLYKRKTMAGEFIMVNKYLVDDLTKLGMWNNRIKDLIILNDGSVQAIEEIPEDIRALYKTVWEIKQKVLIDMAADRGPFVCQSQSMNLFVESPDFRRLSSMHFYSWQRGLKTGIYYLRSKAKAKVQQFTIDPKLSKAKIACDEEVCMACQ